MKKIRRKKGLNWKTYLLIAAIIATIVHFNSYSLFRYVMVFVIGIILLIITGLMFYDAFSKRKALENEDVFIILEAIVMLFIVFSIVMINNSWHREIGDAYVKNIFSGECRKFVGSTGCDMPWYYSFNVDEECRKTADKIHYANWCNAKTEPEKTKLIEEFNATSCREVGNLIVDTDWKILYVVGCNKSSESDRNRLFKQSNVSSCEEYAEVVSR